MSTHNGQATSSARHSTGQTAATPVRADVFVTIAEASSVISRTVPAVAFIENPPLWGAAGWNNVTTSLASCVGAYKVHLFPFGLLDPWNSNESGPTEAAPSLWATDNRLVTALRKIRECDPTAPIILTLYGACWWMKGKLHASNGTTTLMTSLMTYAERYSAEGRVMINYLDDWLLMVDKAVQLAAAEGAVISRSGMKPKAFIASLLVVDKLGTLDMKRVQPTMLTWGIAIFIRQLPSRWLSR